MIITIISTDECIAILVFQLSIDIFFCLLHSNIHVSIQTSQNACMKRKTVRRAETDSYHSQAKLWVQADHTHKLSPKVNEHTGHLAEIKKVFDKCLGEWTQHEPQYQLTAWKLSQQEMMTHTNELAISGILLIDEYYSSDCAGHFLAKKNAFCMYQSHECNKSHAG